jgi:hypothetical protein
MKVNIPGNPDDLIKLAKLVFKKHDDLGAASPLSGIDGIEDFGPQTTTSDEQNIAAKALAKQAEEATQLRDLALGQSGQLREGTVRFFVTSARDILLGTNKGKERKLGDWGFDVSDSSAGPTTPPTTPK